MEKSYFKSSSGRIEFQTLLGLTIVALIAYVGYVVVPPFMDFSLLKAEIKGEAKSAHNYPDEEIAQRVFKKAGEWDIPIEIHKIIVRRNAGVIYISAEYPYTFEFFGGRYEKDHLFYHHIEMKVKESRHDF